MLLYTHIITAIRVHRILKLEEKQIDAYLLGAILPDIRYHAGLPREHTHLRSDTILAIAEGCPATDKQLLAGYLVHLMADELAPEKLKSMLFPSMPKAIRAYVGSGVISIMLEIGYRNEISGPLTFRRKAGCLGKHLGLTEKQVAEMVDQVQAYLKKPTLKEAMKILGKTDLDDNPNIRFYMKVGRTLYQNPLLRRQITARVDRIKGPLEQALAHRCNPLLDRLLKE